MNDALTTDDVRALCVELIARGEQLRATDPERIAHAIARACQVMRDPNEELGRRARDELPASSSLSREMVTWALEHSLDIAERDLLKLIPAAPPTTRAIPRHLSVVVLAGNVFTVPARAMFLPLLCRTPVIAKTSSQETLFPSLLKAALTAIDPLLGSMIGIAPSGGASREVEQILFAYAEVANVYGSDATLRAVRVAAPSTLTLIEHGHGLGAIFISKETCSSDADLETLTHAIALDTAAYDQRGCMSPHAVLVEQGFRLGARTLAKAVAELGLGRLERTLPRGPCSMASGAAQLQWRGTAAACGELFEGNGYATSYEGSRPLRVSSGMRNLAFFDCADEWDLVARLRPWARHLKCLGVGGDIARAARVSAHFEAPSPRICTVGSMQTPPVDALSDGRPPADGLVRFEAL